ncbi:cupin domain-containing protein [Kribbella sp. NPDC051770]|uniref:cupin domain-containing protein n=1 Tax=Kribbella sp. NPDC051770 TaxID=3155413 RepID=UPI003428B83C
MLGVRIAVGLLAVVPLAAACAAQDEPVHAAPVATTSPIGKPPAETLTPLKQLALPNVKGKTFTSAIVDFPPGAQAAPHRHGTAFVYAYVLEGSLRNQLDDQPATTVKAGDNWVELPGAHHGRAENASATEPAKLLVVFVSDTGAQVKIDDPS